MADFDREDLAYTSQAGLYEETDAPVDDQRDISALRSIKKQANQLKAIAKSTESLDLKHPKLTVEQQLFAYQFALEFLDTLTTTIDNAVDKVNKQGRGTK
jgi:hypothetical protein